MERVSDKMGRRALGRVSQYLSSCMNLEIRQISIAKILPVLLLILLFAVVLVTIFVQADSYGITFDEPLQDSYGRSVLSWYQTLGRDQSFMHYRQRFYMPEHGAISEVIVALAQQTFGRPWHTRAVMTGLAGGMGVLAMALCGFELGGWWAAFFAALGLWLYPRFFGAIFNNSKDIPFASATALVLWAMLLLVRKWGCTGEYLIKNAVLVGFLIGLATSIRIVGIFWYLVLLFLFVGWWICYGRSAIREKKVIDHLFKQASSCFIIIVVSWSTIMALWPYIALNPLHNFYDALIINSAYPSGTAEVLFQGHITMAPRSYVPVWLVIGSPPAVIFLAAIGSLIACLKLIKGRVIQIQMLVIGLTLLLPLGILIGFHPKLYNGVRQFLFLVPPLILLAVYGLVSLVNCLMHKKQKMALAGLVVLVLVAQLQVIKDINDLHPYEYMYFSPLVGGIPGASGQYEMDYWAICSKPAAEWLAHNYRKYTKRRFPIITTLLSPKQISLYLPRVFKVRDYRRPDFYIFTTRFASERRFPSYRIIHTEGIQGYTACVIKAKPPSAN
jgi:4-amino-4-deoxy-L-arabinose transferase-like glycosyltransferase